MRVLLIDSVYRKDGSYYPKVFLEKYHFSAKIGTCFDDSYNVDSDEEYSDDSDEKSSDENNQIKKIEFMNLFFLKNKIFHQ